MEAEAATVEAEAATVEAEAATVEAEAATVEAVVGMVEASVEASVVGMVEASVVAVILALVGGMAIGRKAKKPWIGSAIIGADWAVSFGINQSGLVTHGNRAFPEPVKTGLTPSSLSGNGRDDWT
jgi:hypothetical protein